MRIRWLAVFLLLGSLPGCGYLDRFSRSTEGQFTEVTFRSRSAMATNLDGGVMVYAMRSDGFTQTLLLQNRLDPVSVTLPNGSYRFRFVGYSAPSLGGLMYCGFRGPATSAEQEEAIALTGQALTISAELSAERCNGAAFRPQDGNLDVTGGLPLQAVFCSSFTALGGKTAGSLCQEGDESHRFFKGRILAKSKPEGVDLLRSRLIFISDAIADANGRFTSDLYSVGFDGRGLRREVPRIASTSAGLVRGVRRAGIPNNRSVIVYTADDQDLNDPQLQNFEHIYVKPANGAAPVRLSPLSNGTNKFRVPQFQFSPDGRWLAYVQVVCNPTGGCDYSTYLLAKLYVVDLDAANLTPVLVSPTYSTSPGTPWGKGLPFDNCSGCNDPFKVAFNRLADGRSSHIAFTGSFANQRHLSPISTNLVGAPVPVVHAAGSTGAMYYEGSQVAWNFNGTKLLYVGGEVTTWGDPVPYRLYGWEIGVSSNGENIGDNGTHPIGTSGVKGWLKLWPSPVEDKIFYVRDKSSANGAGSFYVSDFSTLTSPVINRAYENFDTANWNNERIDEALWSPDGQKIAFFSSHETNSPSIFFAYLRRLSDAADVIHKVSPGSDPTNNRVIRSGEIEGQVLAVSNTQASFAAKAGSATTSLPFVVDLAPGTPLAVTAHGGAPANATYDLKSFYQDNTLNSLVYLFDDQTDGTYQAFVKYGSGVGGQTALPMPATMPSGSEVFLPGREFNSAALGTGLMFMGANAGASGTGVDLWFLKDYTAPISGSNTLVKLSRSWTDANGAGRFRFGLLNYRREGGQLSNLSPAMESPCFDHSVSGGNDGDVFNTGRKFPVGGAGMAPFVAFVDVFTDESYSCSGPFERQVFVNGFANGIPDQAVGFAHDSGGGAGANFFKIFLRDP